MRRTGKPQAPRDRDHRAALAHFHVDRVRSTARKWRQPKIESVFGHAENALAQRCFECPLRGIHPPVQFTGIDEGVHVARKLLRAFGGEVELFAVET